MSIAYPTLNHPLRVPLAAEAHSRPFLQLEAPETITHLAVYASASTDASGGGAGGSDGGGAAAAGALAEATPAWQQRTLCALCGFFGVSGPADGSARHERH